MITHSFHQSVFHLNFLGNENCQFSSVWFPKDEKRIWLKFRKQLLPLDNGRIELIGYCFVICFLKNIFRWKDGRIKVIIHRHFVGWSFLWVLKTETFKKCNWMDFWLRFWSFSKKNFLQYNLFKFKIMFLCYSKLKTRFSISGRCYIDIVIIQWTFSKTLRLIIPKSTLI